MAILKSRSKREGHRFIGVVVAPWVFEYITLYALAYGTKKSVLYKELMEDWVSKGRIRNTDDVMLRELVDRIKESMPDGMGLKEYKESIYKELNSNGLKESYINLVLSEIV
jgi:hypothetical protein